MSISFRAAGSPASSAGATSASVARPAGAATGDLLILVLGFEGRAAGSAPWVDPNIGGGGGTVIGPFTGWQQVIAQAPSATGNGLEVWAAVNGGTGAVTVNFTGSYPYDAAMLAYIGEDAPTDSILDEPIRASVSAQVTGSNPATPDIYAFQNELVMRVAAQQVNSGYTAPAGYTQRLDAARGATNGNVEIVVADATAAISGNAGALAFIAATTGSPKGATATLAIRPKPLPAGPGSAALNFRFKPA